MMDPAPPLMDQAHPSRFRPAIASLFVVMALASLFIVTRIVTSTSMAFQAPTLQEERGGDVITPFNFLDSLSSADTGTRKPTRRGALRRAALVVGGKLCTQIMPSHHRGRSAEKVKYCVSVQVQGSVQNMFLPQLSTADKEHFDKEHFEHFLALTNVSLSSNTADNEHFDNEHFEHLLSSSWESFSWESRQ